LNWSTCFISNPVERPSVTCGVYHGITLEFLFYLFLWFYVHHLHELRSARHSTCCKQGVTSSIIPCSIDHFHAERSSNLLQNPIPTSLNGAGRMPLSQSTRPYATQEETRRTTPRKWRSHRRSPFLPCFTSPGSRRSNELSS
jgi:hypothetical protein